LNADRPDQDDDATAQHAQLVLTVYSGLRVMARSGMKNEDLEMAKIAVLENLTG